MARQVQEREDLLRDATALKPRMSLKTNHTLIAGEVFLGFRGRNLSLYFGSDPVFHFNPVGQLRRAFYRGRIVRAEKGHLVRWETERTDQATVQHCKVLFREEIDDLRQNLLERVAALQEVLVEQDYELIGAVPHCSVLLSSWNAWLMGWQRFDIADVPNLGEPPD